MDILSTKTILNFALPLNPKEAQRHLPFVWLLKALILIRNDSLTSEESKAKNRL